MPSKGISSIRNASGKLNFSKGGSTSIYVDQSASNASDKNDGFSWDRPKETFAGATDILESWMEIWVRSGTYQENVVIDKENVIIHGVVQAGVDKVQISPLSGVPLALRVGYAEVEGVALVSSNANALEATGPGHKVHDCYVEVNSDGLAQRTAVLLNDCDNILLRKNHLSGLYGLNTIGIRADGTLNPSVDGVIEENYIEKFGTVATAGQGINLNNAQRFLVYKNIFDSCYNGIYCEVKANGLHSMIGNQFYANASVDICDMNTDQQTSGNFINNNFFGYSGWYQDNNHDGIADVPIQCYYNYDYSPLAYPHFQSPSFIPRYVA